MKITTEQIYENVTKFNYTGEKINTFRYIKNLNHTTNFEYILNLPEVMGISVTAEDLQELDWDFSQMYSIAERLDEDFLDYEITEIFISDKSFSHETELYSTFIIQDPVSLVEYEIRWQLYRPPSPGSDDFEEFEIPEPNIFTHLMREYYICKRTLDLLDLEYPDQDTTVRRVINSTVSKLQNSIQRMLNTLRPNTLGYLTFNS